MTTQYEAHRALNQLMSLVVGRERAVETATMETTPLERVKRLKALVDQDYRQCVELGDTKQVKQVERTMASLESLRVLAEIVQDHF